MAEYQLIISGVHYGANGDFVAGQKDTEEMHVRTREMLSWIDRERPIEMSGDCPLPSSVSRDSGVVAMIIR